MPVLMEMYSHDTQLSVGLKVIVLPEYFELNRVKNNEVFA